MKFLARTRQLGAVPFRPAHAARLAAWMSRDPLELFYTSSSLEFPVTAARFEKHRRAADRRTHEFISVVHRPTGRHIGHFELKNISRRHGAGVLSNVLLGDLEFRGKGLGKELCRLMASYAFDKRGLYRLGLSVHTGNRPAVRAYRKGGFREEGVIRDVLSYKGRRYSLYQMSLLRPEWAKIKKREVMKERA